MSDQTPAPYNPDAATLDDFVQEISRSAQRFRDWYLKERAAAASPDYWPVVTDDGTWFEQYMDFMTSGRDPGDADRTLISD